jgi:4-hydroxy-tetrahydrodipicolinate synthase
MIRSEHFVMSATTFAPDGTLDEDAFRRWLHRFRDLKLGVYVGSGGNGEGHALTPAELDRVYRIAVE